MVTMFRKPTNQTNKSNQNDMKQEHNIDFNALENKSNELLKIVRL